MQVLFEGVDSKALSFMVWSSGVSVWGEERPVSTSCSTSGPWCAGSQVSAALQITLHITMHACK